MKYVMVGACDHSIEKSRLRAFYDVYDMYGSWLYNVLFPKQWDNSIPRCNFIRHLLGVIYSFIEYWQLLDLFSNGLFSYETFVAVILTGLVAVPKER